MFTLCPFPTCTEFTGGHLRVSFFMFIILYLFCCIRWWFFTNSLPRLLKIRKLILFRIHKVAYIVANPIPKPGNGLFIWGSGSLSMKNMHSIMSNTLGLLNIEVCYGGFFFSCVDSMYGKIKWYCLWPKRQIWICKESNPIDPACVFWRDLGQHIIVTSVSEHCDLLPSININSCHRDINFPRWVACCAYIHAMDGILDHHCPPMASQIHYNK